MLCKRLNELKEKSKMTNAQISAKSKVPLPTVNRILAGKTYDPGFRTVSAMVKAMGGKLEDLAVCSDEPYSDTPSLGEPFCTSLGDEGVSHELELLLELYEKDDCTRQRWIRVLSAVLFVFVAVVLGILIVDILSPTVGWFQR